MSSNLAWRSLPAAALSQPSPWRDHWNALNAAGLDLCFLDADAVALAIEVFGTGHERLVAAQQGDGQVVAMFVLVPEGGLRWRTFQPSQMPLGAWVAARGASLPALCRSLQSGGALGLCLALSVTQVDPRQVERTPEDDRTQTLDFVPTAWVEVEGRFEDYWAARGKNLRQNMRKQRNKLAADGTPVAMRQWHSAADMAAVIARYGALESTGWKASQGTAIHPDNAQGRYYRGLLEQAAARGEALVFEYLFGDRTVAMDLCLLRGGVLVVLKTTYDESIPKALSPAALLREEELQYVFDGGSGIRRIEYYGRVMEWHTKLTPLARTLYHVTAYRWPLVKSLAEYRRRRADAKARVLAAPLAAPADAPSPAAAEGKPAEAKPAEAAEAKPAEAAEAA